MRKIFISLLLIICLICIPGCSTNESTNESTNAMEKHVVQITKENYKKFITIETNVVSGDSFSTAYHYFRGALTYGFYDDVVITYNWTSTSGDVSEEILSLNVGGCATIVTVSTRYGSSNYEITNVSGTIIYWI